MITSVETTQKALVKFTFIYDKNKFLRNQRIKRNCFNLLQGTHKLIGNIIFNGDIQNLFPPC